MSHEATSEAVPSEWGFRAPSFYFLPTLASLVLPYPLAGALYAIPMAAGVLLDQQNPIVHRVMLALFLLFLGAIRSSFAGGFPTLDQNHPTNLYPLIIPLMLLLLALTSGAVRLGSSRNYAKWALLLVFGLILVGCTAGMIDFGFIRHCGPYMCD